MTSIPYALWSERQKNALFVKIVREKGLEPVECYANKDGAYLETTTGCFSICPESSGQLLVRIDGIPDGARPVRLFR